MPIHNVIQKKNKVYIYDENNKLLFSKYGKLHEFNENSVSIITQDSLLVVRTYNEQGEEIKWDFLKFKVDVEFEYRGVTIKGYGVYDKKNYSGATMTSPIKGIESNITYHINAGFQLTFNENQIKDLAKESLKKAYDEYLLLINEKQGLSYLLRSANNQKKFLEKDYYELCSTETYIYLRFKNKEITESDYKKLVSPLKREKLHYEEKLKNAFIENYQKYYNRKTVIKNLEEMVKLLVGDELDEEDYFSEIARSIDEKVNHWWYPKIDFEFTDKMLKSILEIMKNFMTINGEYCWLSSSQIASIYDIEVEKVSEVYGLKLWSNSPNNYDSFERKIIDNLASIYEKDSSNCHFECTQCVTSEDLKDYLTSDYFTISPISKKINLYRFKA